MDGRYTVDPSVHGGLAIWAWPVDGHQYIVGVDSAAGGPESDFSVAVVIDAEEIEVVALWRERMGPIPWGRACAFLGWHYNEALVAFETGCSAHGMSAAHAAGGIGYDRLYKRQLSNVITRDATEQLGWATNVATKPELIASLREALEAGITIPSEDVIVELKERRYDENERVIDEGHDDIFIALGVAVTVRRRVWTTGALKRAAPRPKLEHEIFWAQRDAALKQRGAMSGSRRWRPHAR